ncbi:toll/interleukin-1 receptor domain-containing protein [Dokdonia sp.]|uniref:toll/interleukin-1 receptor domain-containing protein n=1 Tax=Dokdonia sp. TaxID=2024995 RepID=UPI003265A3A0
MTETQLNKVIEDLDLEIGLQDAESGIITVSKPISLNDKVFKSKTDKRIFPHKEIRINNWEFCRNPIFSVSLYKGKSEPEMSFSYEFPEVKSYLSNEADLDAVSSFVLYHIDENLKALNGFELISENWRTTHKDSTELANTKRKESKEKNFITYSFWESNYIYFSIDGEFFKNDIIRNFAKIYCHLTYQLYSLFSEVLSCTVGMKPTDEFRKFTHKRSEKSDRKIFISYSRKFDQEVEKILNKLKQSMLEFWFDKNQITYGDFIDEKIEDGIESSIGFLFFLSPDINKKFYPRAELSLAFEKCLKDESYFLIPVLLDEIGNLKMPIELARRMYVYPYDDNKDLDINSLESLMTDLMKKAIKDKSNK